MIGVGAETARRIITHLKAGTTPVDCVELLNVGNERWYKEAAAQFDDVTLDGDSVVRFVNGYYGDGKTHFLGMLRSIALSKQWAVTYVTAEATPLHKFENVYSQLIKGLTLPPSIQLPEWLSSERRGGEALLAAVFARLYQEANRLPERSGLQKERVLEALRKKAIDVAAQSGIHQLVGNAVISYVEAIIRDDRLASRQIAGWLAGEALNVPASVGKRIDQKNARDITRSISLLCKRAGIGGVLVLLDEAERIMSQSRTVRAKSYGVIRDLLDNADNQGGMRSSVTYLAGTPELFYDAKGFPEYDALRSRLVGAGITIPGLVDWRGVVVDLTKTPLPHDALIQVAQRIVDVHEVAREWRAGETFTPEIIGAVVSKVESGGFLVSKNRLLAAYMASLLDTVEQNRDLDPADVLETLLASVHSKLAEVPAPAQWS